jgi:hypothetical protein
MFILSFFRFGLKKLLWGGMTDIHSMSSGVVSGINNGSIPAGCYENNKASL